MPRRPPDPVASKLDRLTRNAAPRFLDLFGGCGGLSLGFHAAGFEPVGAVEMDDEAARTHALNFHPGLTGERFEAFARPRDICQVEPAALLAELSHEGRADEAVDVILGGPPCQAYARVGRAKLREVGARSDAFLHDARGRLFERYLHYVAALKPLAVVMENVPDVLNYGGRNVAEVVCDELDRLGYDSCYTLLNAAFYGVPQMRERVFLLGWSRLLGRRIAHPEPTHWADLPAGYAGSRSVALRTVGGTGGLFPTESRYVRPPAAGRALPPAVTAREALGDLPAITAHLTGGLTRGARRVDEEVQYAPAVQPSRYARLMRGWPGFDAAGGVTGHVIRSLPRDYAIFRRMNPGDQYPEAHRHAVALFEEALGRMKRGKRKPPGPGTAAYRRLWEEMVPPYDPNKFPNKWRKLEPDRPSRTLMAHIGKDTYSHIHYDSDQARTISVREAARLQSFPDGFVFCGAMNAAFRQIGNAVPPLLSHAVAKQVASALGVRPHVLPTFNDEAVELLVS